MHKKIERVLYDRTFRLIGDPDQRLYHVRDGSIKREISIDGYVEGENVCVQNTQGVQRLLPWGTVVDELTGEWPRARSGTVRFV